MHASNKKLRNGWMLTKFQRLNNDSMTGNVKKLSLPTSFAPSQTLMTSGLHHKNQNSLRVVFDYKNFPPCNSFSVVACFQRIHIPRSVLAQLATRPNDAVIMRGFADLGSVS